MKRVPFVVLVVQLACGTATESPNTEQRDWKPGADEASQFDGLSTLETSVDKNPDLLSLPDTILPLRDLVDLVHDSLHQPDIALDSQSDIYLSDSRLEVAEQDQDAVFVSDCLFDLSDHVLPDGPQDDVAPLQDFYGDWVELPPTPNCPDDSDLIGPTFSGTIYFDSDGSSDSLYYQGIAPAFDSPLEGVTVEVHLPDGSVLTRSTCPNGIFSFGSLPDGLALSRPFGPETMWPSTANAPRRFPDAIQEGEITIVTLGDSIPSFGAQPFFPDRLADLLTPFALVHSINIAVPGTATDDWMPSTNRFKNDALPVILDADVVVISLGGNDLNYWVGYDGELTFEEAMELATEFPVIMQEVRTNMDAIITAIQDVNPQADIIYIIYPNYAASTYWTELAAEYINLVSSALNNELGKTRKHFSRPGITLVDMLGAPPLIDLDSCLSDPLHLSELGTHVWARQVFLALGGLEVGNTPLGLLRNSGFTPLP